MQITEKPPRETIGGNAVVTAVCARLFLQPVHPSSTHRQPHFNHRGQSARAPENIEILIHLQHKILPAL